MVGSDSKSDSVHAVRVSMENSRTKAGINSSPPATPMRAATTPLPKPIETPRATCATLPSPVGGHVRIRSATKILADSLRTGRGLHAV